MRGLLVNCFNCVLKRIVPATSRSNQARQNAGQQGNSLRLQVSDLCQHGGARRVDESRFPQLEQAVHVLELTDWEWL
jgi:hypothetical protein